MGAITAALPAAALAAVVFAYLAPSLLTHRRDQSRFGAASDLNLMLWSSFPVWIAALALAFNSQTSA